MVDLNNYASIVGLAGLIGLILQFLWPQGISTKLKPYVGCAIGLLFSLAIGYVMGNIKSGADWLSWAIGGFLSGVTATGGYELTVDKLKPQS